MARRTYTKDDVQTHSDGFGAGRPAVNVKVYGTLEQGYREFVKDEQPDPRFTLEWIEENVNEQTLDAIFWNVCEFEFEYLQAFAGTDEDAIFPAARYGKVEIVREGRSGGWAVAEGLPDVEDWDAIDLARWRKFERVARAIADGIMLQVCSSLYLNEWELAEQERHEDAGTEADVAATLATLAR